MITITITITAGLATRTTITAREAMRTASPTNAA